MALRGCPAWALASWLRRNLVHSDLLPPSARPPGATEDPRGAHAVPLGARECAVRNAARCSLPAWGRDGVPGEGRRGCGGGHCQQRSGEWEDLLSPKAQPERKGLMAGQALPLPVGPARVERRSSLATSGQFV